MSGGGSEARFVLPWRWRLRAAAIVVARGFAIGLLLYLSVTALFYGAGALITTALRLAWPWLAELPFAAAAGLTVVPLYFLWEIALVARARSETIATTFSNALGAMYASNATLPPEPDARDIALARFKGRQTVRQFRAGFIGFCAVVVFDQCLLAALLLYGLLESGLIASPFATAAEPSLAALYAFFLQAPLDVALLGAPGIYGVGLSSLEASEGATAFKAAVLFFKVVLISEFVRLVGMFLRIEPNHASDEADAMRAAAAADAGRPIEQASPY